MPTFGQEIRRLREEKRWNQKQLCDACGMDYSVLSRIESGKIKAPTDATVRSLATALQASEEHLLAIATGLRERDRSTIRLGAAHCIWAAPAFLLAMRGRLPMVSLTSYGVLGGNSVLGDPYWYDAESLRDARTVKAGPSFIFCGGQQLERVQEWPSAEPLHAFTGNDLVSLISGDPPALDGLLAAQEAMKSYSQRMIRCARILQLEGGCSLLLAVTNKKLESLGFQETPQTFESLWSSLPDNSLKQIPILCAPATNAEQNLSLLLEGHVPGKPAFDPVVYIDLGIWDQVSTTVANALSEVGIQNSRHLAMASSAGIYDSAGRVTNPTQASGQTPELDENTTSGVFAFLGWEPQLSWIEAQARSKGAQCYCLRRLTQHVQRRLPTLSFDIMLCEDALSGSPPGGTVQRFLELLGGAIRELRSAAGPTSSTVQVVARYLNMAPRKCFEAISELPFELMYYPEWVEYIQR